MASTTSDSESSYNSDVAEIRNYSDHEGEVELSSGDEVVAKHWSWNIC